MKIFFAAAIRGGRGEQPLYGDILHILNTYGTVLSAHVADEAMSAFGETELTEQEIHARELDRIAQSNVIVAEVTTPSLGVGYLLHAAVSLGKPTVCLYHGKHTDGLSAMIKGDTGIEVCRYEHVSDVDTALRTILNRQ